MLMISNGLCSASKSKLRTISRRDISRLLVSDLEDPLETIDWLCLYNTNDPNEAVAFLLKNVKEVHDTVCPIKAIKIRPGKPKISLKHEILATMALRYEARRTGNRERFKVLRDSAAKLLKWP